jgi:hypothetical protein
MFETRMPFGKYRGWLLSQIPVSYLCWVLANCHNIDLQLRTEIRRIVEQARRDAYDMQDESPAGSGLPARWDDVITRWYREMALRYHPDRGGSTEVMQALNHAHERLKELVGV